MCVSPEVDVIMSEETVIDAGGEENGSAEETDFSTVSSKTLHSAVKLCFVEDVRLINRSVT